MDAKCLFLAVLLLCIATLPGCVSRPVQVSLAPDGTLHMTKGFVATMGVKADQFKADTTVTRTADGGFRVVDGGTGADASTPDTLSVVIPAIVQMYGMGVAAGNEQALAEISAGLRTPGAAKTDLLQRLLDKVSLGAGEPK